MGDDKKLFGLDLKVDQDYIEEAVKQTVLMGIAEGLNEKNGVTSQIVKMVLETRVNNKGEISSYSSDNKYTLLEYYVRKMIEEVTAEEMKNMVNEHRDEIAKTIRAELQKKVNYTKFVDRFIDNIATAISDSWCPKIEVNFDRIKESDF